MRATKTEPASRASLSVLQLRSAPQQVRSAERGDVLGRRDGVVRILEILRSHFAPEAADAIHQQVMRFMHYRRAGQWIDEYVLEFDPLRRKAESKIEMGAGFPEHFISILRVNNAGLPRQEKPLKSQKPEVRGGSGQRQTIIWIARCEGSPKCIAHRGSSWALGER